MCCQRYLLLLMGTVCFCLWSVAPAQQPSQPVGSSQAAKPVKADVEAVKFLDEAIKELDVKKLEWVEASLWQQLNMPGFVVEAEGSYLAGPDHRLRLDLKVNLGGKVGQLQVICDGAALWETFQAPSGDKEIIRKVDVKKVLDAMNSPGMPQQAVDEFWQNQSFAGVSPLLQTLQKRMTLTKHERTRWQGHEMMQLTAVWSQDTKKDFIPAGQPWPLSVPGQCRLYLDAAAPHWPYRLEWWAEEPNGRETLVLQMEYREPKWKHQPLPEKIKDAFTFDPGSAKVPDRTQTVIDLLKTRAKTFAPGPGRR